ncbi:hypothetical protein SCLCIDRAFT_34817 [Scleroderma citrinum Foug A]|uniref:Uncharacterized protein n=1 Tax=Scleroderma citrinum Foug A TaxID=1036808 RepID=A0A0C3D0R0_9AGAM|nr:hypothetical protein SCLCIDRAFT_34817 [Scleroderma citrinum Foug A]
MYGSSEGESLILRKEETYHLIQYAESLKRPKEFLSTQLILKPIPRLLSKAPNLC